MVTFFIAAALLFLRGCASAPFALKPVVAGLRILYWNDFQAHNIPFANSSHGRGERSQDERPRSVHPRDSSPENDYNGGRGEDNDPTHLNTYRSRTMKDLASAFSFPFKDDSWLSKFVIAALFMLLCLVGLGIFVLAGYLIQVTQRVMRKEQNALPDWSDVGVKFVVGFKFVVVIFLYCLPAIILIVPLFVLIGLNAIAQNDSLAVLTAVYTFGYMLLVIPYSLVLAALFPIIQYRFALNERIGEALEIGTICRLFTNNWESSAIVALIALGLQSISGIGIFFFFIGIFFTVLYAYLVPAYLSGTLYLEHQEGGKE